MQISKRLKVRVALLAVTLLSGEYNSLEAIVQMLELALAQMKAELAKQQ